MEKLLNEENDRDQDTTYGKKEGPMCRIAAHEVSSVKFQVKFSSEVSSGKDKRLGSSGGADLCNDILAKKASGPSGVVAEIMRAKKGFGIEWLTDLCNDILAEGKIPSDWKRSVLVPVYTGKVIHWNVDHIQQLNYWNRQ